MDYEKIYKDALSRAQKLKKTCDSTTVIGWCEYIFPELKESRVEKPNGGIVSEDFNEGDGFYKVNLAYLSKEQVEEIESLVKKWNPESEDEKIKNWIVAKLTQTCRNATGEEDKDVVEKYYKACAWLEKQSKITIWDKKDEKILNAAISHIKNKTYNYCGGYTSEYVIQWLESLKDRYIWTPSEKQGEQKPADKVEPKFKDGQWIVFNGLTLYINEVVKGYYRTISIDGTPNSYNWDIDNAARLWTLNEAKDGDVLAVNNEVFIYAHRKQMYSIAIAHCFVDSAGGFRLEGEFRYLESGNSISPATTKQRDLLFRKIKEAGYKWDEEKKELIKNMTQLEIYKRQLEIATQMLENAKNHNLSSEDINKYQELYDLCKRSIEIFENNQELFNQEY